jgi:predicted dehydrogenase
MEQGAKMKKIKWGVLSTANIARAAVIPAIQRSSNGELLAVASRSESRAKEFAAALDVPRAYGSYQALLDNDDVDAVYIPLPNSLHREWTVRAAEAGKHILCEKPLAMNTAECRHMDATAERNGVGLMEAFMYRFHPQLTRVQELIQSGAIGKPRLIHSAFSFRLTNPDNIRLKPELGGGALMDVGCYCVNVSRTLAGAEPVEAQAFANWGQTGVDEQMSGSLRFADGLMAQFDCALTLERREFYQVVGPEGYICVPAAFLPGTDVTTICEHHGPQGTTTHTVPGADEYQLMVEHFGDCLLQHKPFRYSPAEAADNMRVIQALYRSAYNGGRPEKV